MSDLHLPCLANIDAARRDALERVARPIRAERGTLVASQGDANAGTLVVLEGLIKVFRASPDGRTQTLWTVGPGECVCLSPSARSGSLGLAAECLEATRYVRIKPESWRRLVGPNGGVAAERVECLSDRLAELAGLAEGLATRSVTERLESFLWTTARRRGRDTDEGVEIRGGVTHEEIAAAIGTAREVVSRLLGTFRAEGLVKTGRDRIVLLDTATLDRRVSAHGPRPGAPRPQVAAVSPAER